MGSDHKQQTRRLRLQLLVATLGMMAASVLLSHSQDSLRLLVSGGLIGLTSLWAGGYALLRLQAPRMVERSSPAAPVTELQQSRLLQLESRLEHAPVALWQLSNGTPAPLNAAAYKLLAPGRANSPDVLLNLIAQTPGNQRHLISFESERGTERAILAATELVIAGQPETLLALMPIESELETETLTAWQQLVHVLTHEIMNSLTPIASLSRTAQELATECQGPATEDLDTALEAIARRASQLADFIAGYRSVSQLPAPILQPVALTPLFGRLAVLVQADWQQRQGSATFTVQPATLELQADPGQLEQALLNLLKNAADATRHLPNPAVEVSARLIRGGRLLIEIIDNGPGVPAGLESRIFTPFFSTKTGGLGVGLALVRNQIHGMGGTVRYAKRAAGGACFVLAF
ncbi:sensor histidine kinase [Parachitinimonas caeni]|uniref:histidine kinase n=1 Tax=Parachitinimonas caeni TaxID=3031301 RepID=A0ABT7E0G9_9NEIS|nr:sensor histidine kinase [Parachitinimonas caeni]MDK2124930.1 ATP-binding protein [Parachitinimonas caeni]